MDKETINKTAMEYSGLTDNSKGPNAREKGCLCIAFSDGAHWRINSVWHEANKEIPIPFRPILVEHDDGKYSVNMVGGNMKSCPLAWARWAYIDDLLPYGKEDNK